MAKKTGNHSPLAPEPPKQPSGRHTLIAVLIGLTLSALLLIPVFMLRGSKEKVPHRIPLSELLAGVDNGSIQGLPITWIEVNDNARAVIVDLEGGERAAAFYPDHYGGLLVNRLEQSGLAFTTDPLEGTPLWKTLGISMIPMVFILGFLIWFARRSGMGAANAKAFTASKVEMGAIPSTRFAEVVGCEEAVEELSEVVSFLHDPTRFNAAGATLPRGFLLVGPPGTGKTLLARAVAGEAGVPFYAASGSDFTEMFVGVGAARVRNLFAQAKKTGGIVFVDELDSVGRARSGSNPHGGGTDEREGTLNALLVEMDGFGKGTNVIVIAATNRPDVLDPALLRAGRFDRQVTVATPDRKGRTVLLELYARARRVAPDVDLVALARRIPGLTGADIANLVNQAALEAARDRREEIQTTDFDEALATIIMGRARRSAVVDERDREITAWHEAGHAVAALTLPESDNPVQVTIIPRGPSGGATWFGRDDHTFKTRSKALAELTVSLAGRAAEEMLLDGDFTHGASGDLQAATSLAGRMVTEWGMSSLGLATLGPEYAEPGVIRAEIDRILGDALENARRLLADNRALLERVVAELLDEETIDGAQMMALRDGLVVA